MAGKGQYLELSFSLERQGTFNYWKVRRYPWSICADRLIAIPSAILLTLHNARSV